MQSLTIESPSPPKEPCFICTDQDDTTQRVCKCTSFVHTTCLNKWRQAQFITTEKPQTRCSICLSEYTVPLPKIDMCPNWIATGTSRNPLWWIFVFVFELASCMLCGEFFESNAFWAWLFIPPLVMEGVRRVAWTVYRCIHPHVRPKRKFRWSMMFTREVFIRIPMNPIVPFWIRAVCAFFLGRSVSLWILSLDITLLIILNSLGLLP